MVKTCKSKTCCRREELAHKKKSVNGNTIVSHAYGSPRKEDILSLGLEKVKKLNEIRNHVRANTTDDILLLLESGLSHEEIADRLSNISKTVISRDWMGRNTEVINQKYIGFLKEVARIAATRD
jgi:hypothetical protein